MARIERRRFAVVAIGDHVLDIRLLEERKLLRVLPFKLAFARPNLNWFMEAGPKRWRWVRQQLSALLSGADRRLADDPALQREALHRRADVTMELPFAVAGFTDFYSSREHAENVGRLFRPGEDPLPPNWLSMPIAYNGRASTVVVSGTAIHRPMGQILRPDAALPDMRPTERLDFELELGAVVGQASALGSRLSVAQAQASLFGVVILNDWSARDVQQFEYRPLGPFQGKAFATTISPFVVTFDALAPFMVDGPARERSLLPYLQEEGASHIDLDLSVALSPADGPETVLSRANARGLYYSAAQQLAHHSSSGCAMSVGDLLGSGTISGASPGSQGSMLELTRNGTEPLVLEGGARRAFLEDGDTVRLTGVCRREGFAPIGFGACEGQILPALPDTSEAIG